MMKESIARHTEKNILSWPFDGKTILWLADTNKYILAEEFTGKVIQLIAKRENIHSIIHFCTDEFNITSEQAEAFVNEIQQLLNEYLQPEILPEKQLENKNSIQSNQSITASKRYYTIYGISFFVNALNTQVNDEAYLKGDINLRQMYDLLLLSALENPQTVLNEYPGFPNKTNAWLATASMVFGTPTGIEYDNNIRVRCFMKWFNFFLTHPGHFHSAYKSIIYIFWRLSRYVTLPFQSIYRKDVRACGFA